MGDDDWKLLRDFESIPGAPPKPKWEYQIIDGGETVAFRKIPGIPDSPPHMYYIPTQVIEAIPNEELQEALEDA